MKDKYREFEEIKIYFRIPFTMYWLGRIQGECRHEWSKLYLFVKEFDCENWYFKIVH